MKDKNLDNREEIPNAETKKAIEASEKGEDVYGPFDSVKELIEELEKLKLTPRL